MAHAHTVPNCYEVLGEVDGAIRRNLESEDSYFVLGGVVTSALQHPDTNIDTACGVVEAASGSAEPVIRPNGTRRDIDLLIDKVLEPQEAQTIQDAVQAATDDELVVDVFGMKPYTEEPTTTQRIGWNLGRWVSSRTVDAKGTIRYELFPLAQEVSPNTFIPWKLATPIGEKVDILHPVGHYLAYSMRSISGPRHKDQAKVEAMREKVLSYDEFKEEMFHGDFQAWRNFGAAIEDIRDGVMGLGDAILRPGTEMQDLDMFRRKAKTLKFLEENSLMVKFAQTSVGSAVLRGIVHA
jgi:hypothetical protein